jgi:hypothetical protein
MCCMHTALCLCYAVKLFLSDLEVPVVQLHVHCDHVCEADYQVYSEIL